MTDLNFALNGIIGKIHDFMLLLIKGFYFLHRFYTTKC